MNLDQLLSYVRLTGLPGYEKFINQLMETGGYQIMDDGSISLLYQQNGWHDIIDPEYWFLCDPIYMKFLFNRFKTEMIEFLNTNVDDDFDYKHRICEVAMHNRVDLLQIIYGETDVFLENVDVIYFAAKNGKLEAVRYLTEKGASCTVDAMDMASLNGHLEIVKYLHLNRSEGCFLALVVSSRSCYFEIVKFLVENGLGINRIQEAIDSAKIFGHPEVAKYLEDHLQED